MLHDPVTHSIACETHAVACAALRVTNDWILRCVCVVLPEMPSESLQCRRHCDMRRELLCIGLYIGLQIPSMLTMANAKLATTIFFSHLNHNHVQLLRSVYRVCLIVQ